MSNGTPEQDLNTYMNNQDQQQAELDQEQREAEDTAWEIHEFIDSAPRLLSDNHTDDMEVIHHTDGHVLSINILMSEVESEVLKEYIKVFGSKFVQQNYWEEE